MSAPPRDPVQVEREAGVAVITIQHPPANALSLAVLAGIRGALSEAGADAACRAVMIVGEGSRFFSAGADLNEVGSEGAALRIAGRELAVAIESHPLPVVVAVNGAALGGGCELALAGDIRLAAATATFGQPEVNLGIMPGWGGTQRLPRLIGSANALALLLSGESITAQRALEIGLVSQLAAPERLRSEAHSVAAALAGKAPLAMAAIKRAVRQGLDQPLADGLEIEEQELTAVLAGGDAAEGIIAFLEKRAPRWGGR